MSKYFTPMNQKPSLLQNFNNLVNSPMQSQEVISKMPRKDKQHLQNVIHDEKLAASEDAEMKQYATDMAAKGKAEAARAAQESLRSAQGEFESSLDTMIKPSMEGGIGGALNTGALHVQSFFGDKMANHALQKMAAKKALEKGGEQVLKKGVEKSLEKRGVLIHRNSRLTDMKIVEGTVQYNLEYTDGSTEVFVVEKALISVGRVPNYENLVDESLGLEVNNGGIVDEFTKTSITNIYAVGDITADISLVNVGELEGRYAVESIFGKPSRPLIYENISTIMFLAPEVSGVGMNERQAQEVGLNYLVASLDYNCIPRAVAMRNTEGFIKIIISEKDNKILGMRVVGQHSSSAIQAIALLISDGRGIEELAELIHPHPSIIEGIQECCRMLLNKSIMKPKVLSGAMYCRSYRNGIYTEMVK